MLTEETVIDRVEILQNGFLQVRRAAYVVRPDGTRFLLQYSRVAYSPGDDVTLEDPKVKDIAGTVWTPEVLQNFEAEKARRPKSPLVE